MVMNILVIKMYNVYPSQTLRFNTTHPRYI